MNSTDQSLKKYEKRLIYYANKIQLRTKPHKSIYELNESNLKN